jgi:hypothetical protein
LRDREGAKLYTLFRDGAGHYHSLIAHLPDTAHVVALCDCHLPRMTSAITPETTSPMVVPLATFRDGDAKS